MPLYQEHNKFALLVQQTLVNDQGQAKVIVQLIQKTGTDFAVVVHKLPSDPEKILVDTLEYNFEMDSRGRLTAVDVFDVFKNAILRSLRASAWTLPITITTLNYIKKMSPVTDFNVVTAFSSTSYLNPVAGDVEYSKLII